MEIILNVKDNLKANSILIVNSKKEIECVPIDKLFENINAEICTITTDNDNLNNYCKKLEKCNIEQFKAQNERIDKYCNALKQFIEILGGKK